MANYDDIISERPIKTSQILKEKNFIGNYDSPFREYSS